MPRKALAGKGWHSMQGIKDRGRSATGLHGYMPPSLRAQRSCCVVRSLHRAPAPSLTRPYGDGLGALSRSLTPCTPLRARFGEHIAMCCRGVQWGTLAGRGGAPLPSLTRPYGDGQGRAPSPCCAFPPLRPSCSALRYAPPIFYPLHSAAIPSLPMPLNISKCSPA